MDATGSVTHDQMAVDYMRRAGCVPPQQQQQPQQARPPSVVHANYPQQKPHHQAHPSVSSQYSQAPAHQLQSPYSYQGAPPGADGRQPYQGHAAKPSVYSTVGQSVPQMAPQQQQYGGHAPTGYGQAPQPPVASQSVPAHMAQYAGSPAPMQNAYPVGAQQPVPPAGQPVGPSGYYVPPMQQQGSQYARAQETPASAYMHEYLQQQQAQQPNGVGHAQQQSTASVAPSHCQQPPQQQQQQWARATSPAPAPAPAAAPPAAGPSQPQGHTPTGQYSDAGQPILFYVKALYDYQATNPDEFSFTTGDIIAVTHTEADGWWQGELLDEARRKQGANTFPSNFVALLM